MVVVMAVLDGHLCEPIMRCITHNVCSLPWYTVAFVRASLVSITLRDFRGDDFRRDEEQNASLSGRL